MEEFAKRINYPRLQNVMIKEGNSASLDIAYSKIVDDIIEDLKKENIIIEGLDEELKKNTK